MPIYIAPHAAPRPAPSHVRFNAVALRLYEAARALRHPSLAVGGAARGIPVAAAALPVRNAPAGDPRAGAHAFAIHRDE